MLGNCPEVFIQISGSGKISRPGYAPRSGIAGTDERQGTAKNPVDILRRGFHPGLRRILALSVSGIEGVEKNFAGMKDFGGVLSHVAVEGDERQKTS